MIWFTSDSHFGHKRIIELAKRPFSSVEEMDDKMVALWNNYVSKSDIVYHLGDFAFAEHTLYLQRLNGQKHLIKGNHDHSNRVKNAVGWQSVNDIVYLSIMAIQNEVNIQIVLCHYAMRVWKNSGHGSLHFYGHSHGNLPGDAQSLDVGVDCWSYQPINLDMIKRKLAGYIPRTEPDHHARQKEISSRTLLGTSSN